MLQKYYSVEPCTNKQAWIIRFTIIFIAGFSIVNIYMNPYQHIFEYFNIQSVNGCPLLTFTGVPCPMCGMGRSFDAIIHLSFSQFFYYNPSGLIFFFFTGVISVVIFGVSLKNKTINLKKPAYKLWFIPVGLLIIVWILNILYGHHN